MILKVRQTTDPILREPATPVTDFGHDFQFLIDNMIETMRKNNGIGLAAPQVGVGSQAFVCEFAGDKDIELPAFPLTVICNPEIVEYSDEKCKMVEGCLSFPGMELLVKRPKKVKVKGLDRYGKALEIEADQLFGRVIQHENDHLHSTLMIDLIHETSLIFIGTGSLGVPSLEALANDRQYKILSVITGEAKSVVSRGQKTQKNLILEKAKELKLPVIETSNINDPKTVEKIAKLKPDLGIMADFGQIIKAEVLAIPKYGIVNIHPSLLPLHRGPSPIQQTILDGDKATGISLILTEKKMDAGGIISQGKAKLSPAETSTTLKDYLADAAATLLLNTLPYYLAGDLKPVPQEESEATYTKLFTKEDGLVTEKNTGEEVERKIRAFSEWPGVYAMVRGKRIQITAAHLEKDGLFVIDRVKPEGKREMTYDEYCAGHKDKLTFSA